MTGNAEAWSDAVGDQLTQLAGFRFTRVSALVASGATVVDVETTFGWPAAGKVIIEGQRYAYASKTPTTLVGITWPDAQPSNSAKIVAVNDAVMVPVTTILPGILRVKVLGKWDGVLTVEESADGTTWTTVTTYVDNGERTVQVAGVQTRVRASSWVSGRAFLEVQMVEGSGVKTALTPLTHVVDYSRTYNALDAVRASVFVDTAEGDLLSALGRNLGVERPPDLQGDDAFRKVIKALAYLPKGTVYGIEIALNAFLGEGNYEIIENFPTSPCTVFIRLLNGITLSDSPVGQTYFARRERAPYDPSDNTVDVAGPVNQVQGVRLADESSAELFATTKPSALVDIRYDGDSGIPLWVFTGTSEANVVMAAESGALIQTIAGETCAYKRTARVIAESTAGLSATVTLTTLSSASLRKQFMMSLCDGARNMAVGFASSGPDRVIGFINATTGAWLTAGAIVVDADRAVDVTVAKRGRFVTLSVHGNVVQSAVTSDFVASTLHEFSFGARDGTTSSVAVMVRGVSFYSTTPVDCWNLRGSVGTTNSGTPTNLNTHSGDIVVGDVGKGLRTTSATIPKNNGLWKIENVIDADEVSLTGFWRTSAFVESAFPLRISIAGVGDAFLYPDDVGKIITLRGGIAPNNDPGNFVIAAILDEDGVTPLSGSFVQKSRWCRVISPPVWSGSPDPWPGFTTQVGMAWRLEANMATDTGVTWELAAAGDFVGTVLTLREDPPFLIPGGYVLIVEATYTTVRSAQAIADGNTANASLGGGDYAFWPFYLPPHPLGPYRAFLDDLTVAGVIPEIEVG